MKNKIKKTIFLQSLKEPREKIFMEKMFMKILMKLSEEISKHINKGDRCLLDFQKIDLNG